MLGDVEMWVSRECAGRYSVTTPMGPARVEQVGAREWRTIRPNRVRTLAPTLTDAIADLRLWVIGRGWGEVIVRTPWPSQL